MWSEVYPVVIIIRWQFKKRFILSIVNSFCNGTENSFIWLAKKRKAHVIESIERNHSIERFIYYFQVSVYIQLCTIWKSYLFKRILKYADHFRQSSSEEIRQFACKRERVQAKSAMGGGGSKKPKPVEQPQTQQPMPPPLEQPKRDVSLTPLRQTSPSPSPVEEERPRISSAIRPISSASTKKAASGSFLVS